MTGEGPTTPSSGALYQGKYKFVHYCSKSRIWRYLRCGPRTRTGGAMALYSLRPRAEQRGSAKGRKFAASDGPPQPVERRQAATARPKDPRLFFPAGNNCPAASVLLSGQPCASAARRSPDGRMPPAMFFDKSVIPASCPRWRFPLLRAGGNPLCIDTALGLVRAALCSAQVRKSIPLCAVALGPKAAIAARLAGGPRDRDCQPGKRRFASRRLSLACASGL